MRVKGFIVTMLTVASLGACDSHQSTAVRQVLAAPAAERIDPRIAALTITAKRMTAAEKVAYDQAQRLQLAQIDTIQ